MCAMMKRLDFRQQRVLAKGFSTFSFYNAASGSGVGDRFTRGSICRQGFS